MMKIFWDVDDLKKKTVLLSKKRYFQLLDHFPIKLKTAVIGFSTFNFRYTEY